MPEFTTTSASSYPVKTDTDSLQAILFSSNTDHSTTAATMGAAALEQSTANGKRKNGKKDTVKAGGIKKAKAADSNSLALDRAGSHQRMGSVASSNADSSRDENDNDNDNDAFDDSGRDSVGAKDGKTEHERRRKFLERNRLAASKCRQKKKMWVQELERRAEDATMQNRSLHIAVAQLKEEVLILKNQLLTHHSCGCNAVQQYIQNGCGAPATGPSSVAHAQQMQRSQGFQGHNPYYMSQNPHQVDLSAVLTTTPSSTGARAYSGGEV
ncbi:hypothetical protein LPJ81_001805 [Coemansia sp. IMI 209127]|nr:hypothetical protein LPJ81_001805 [Coemansia sp. IMI 209127]